MAIKKQDETAIEIPKMGQEIGRFGIVGTTPFICNRQSEKVKRELLVPAKKTKATRDLTAKHDMLQEYRDSPYLIPIAEETLLGVRAVSFKKSMMTAALDLPGAQKSQIGRLVTVRGELIPLYGIPQLFTTDVRQAGMNKTPDIRTRAILPRWAAWIEVSFASPTLKAVDIGRLLAAAGMFVGVGDWRIEKGSGSYGGFRLKEEADSEFDEIVATGTRAAQQAALDDPSYYDRETRELVEWFRAEVARRGFKVAV